MGVRKISEVAIDGPSIILWEAGKGSRIVYNSPEQAEEVGEWLTEKLNQFHLAKEANTQEDESMVTLYIYGESITEFAFIRRFISIARSARLAVDANLERSSAEFW